MVKSRKLLSINKDIKMGEPLPHDAGYCRKCQKIKRSNEFFKATDVYLDTNELMSVCKDCINEMYSDILLSQRGSIEKTVLQICKLMNVKYDEESIRLALEHIKAKGTSPAKFFGTYLLKLVITNRGDFSNVVDLTYKDSPIVNAVNFEEQYESVGKDEQAILDDLRLFWGDYSLEDYNFLERELSEWKQSYSCQNKGEEFILKELCYKALELKQAREQKKDTASILKATQEIMKNGALTPAQANAASSSKQADTLGNWIRDIETMTPAEWVKDKNMFADVDNLEEYTRENIISPLRSFVTGSKEFSIEGAEMEEDDFEE